MTYLIIAIVIIAGVAFWIISRRTKEVPQAEPRPRIPAEPEMERQESKENAYSGLRDTAFSVTPAQLGLSFSAGETKVYGIIMDWEMGGSIATTVAFQTGDASLYLSTGGGVIGGVQHKKVVVAARNFVELGQHFLEKAQKTSSKSLPGQEMVIFYLLTNNGIYSGEDAITHFESGTSEWMDLFEEGNNVLAELREISAENE